MSEIEPLDSFEPGFHSEVSIKESFKYRSCSSKVRYVTESDAVQKGMKVYPCLFCKGFHQSVDKVFAAQRRLERNLNRQEDERRKAEAEKRKAEKELRKANKVSRWRGRNRKIKT